MEITIVGKQKDPAQDSSVSNHQDGMSGVNSDDLLSEIAVAQIFDLDHSDQKKYKEKIKTILDWARPQVKEKDFTSLKWIIKTLESKLGSPNFGETRISKVARYAYLDMEGKRLEQEKLSLT